MSDWRKVEKIDESMIGWEVNFGINESGMKLIHVDGEECWIIDSHGSHSTYMTADIKLVRPPAIPKKKTSERFWEKYREAYWNPTVAGAYPDIGMDMKVLLLVLDEQFEREGNK